MNIVPFKSAGLIPSKAHIEYLSDHQLNALTAAYQGFFDSSPSPRQYVKRGKHWLIFLILRFSGARLGEVLSLSPDNDVDYRNGELRLVTLKQHKPTGVNKKERKPTRIVPVPPNIIGEISNYRLQVAKYVEKGEVSKREVNPFRLNPATFRKMFYRLTKEAGIPSGLNHPHSLRHSRAVEILRAGVPVTVVQDLLGHSSLNTTAIYLRISGHEAKVILRDRGLI